MPIWLSVSSRPLPFSVSRPAMEPTMVTSRPSRIQTVPSPMTTSQCHLDQGNRSMPAGMLVFIVPVSAPLTAASRYVDAHRSGRPVDEPDGDCPRRLARNLQVTRP